MKSKIDPCLSLLKIYGLSIKELLGRRQYYCQNGLPTEINDGVEEFIVKEINPELDMRDVRFLVNNLSMEEKIQDEIDKLERKRREVREQREKHCFEKEHDKGNESYEKYAELGEEIKK